MTRKRYVISRIGICLVLTLALSGCLTTDAQKGAVGGAGIGALAGQVIGANTTSTLIGAGVGMGLGYMIGNERDKKKAMTTNQTTAPTDYGHKEVGELGGTKWKVVSVNPTDAFPPSTSKSIEFQPDGYMVTTTTNLDGTVDVDNEHYRVVGNTLIMNGPGYIVNARFGVQNDQLVMDAEEFSVVLQKL